jgi:hypothetical protein
MHTPRLCIDGRIAYELPFEGIEAQNVIDQLVCATGELEASSEWLEKKRTVLLTHPEQVFSGQLKRHNTKWKVGKSPLHLLWEKHFEKNSNVSAFHRIRPVDTLTSTQRPTVTTLLPPLKGLPLFISRRRNHHYVVPSLADAQTLEKQYSISPDHISVLKPSPRRYVFFTDGLEQADTGNVLVLTDGKHRDLEKLRHVFQLRYKHLPLKIVSLKKKNTFSPSVWTKLLADAKICLYLVSQPFDWATLALESLYWKRPTLFADDNRALNGLLPRSPLRLSSFLVNQPELSLLRAQADAAFEKLNSQGIYDPLLTARQYRKVYEKLPTDLLGQEVAEDDGCCSE